MANPGLGVAGIATLVSSMLDSRRRILTFADRLSSVGGSEIAQQLICRELARNGWALSVGYVEAGDLLDPWLRSDAHLFRVAALVPTRDQLVASGIGVIAAAARAAWHPADVVYVHNPVHSIAGEVAATLNHLRRRGSVPTIVHLHLPPPIHQPAWLDALLRRAHLVIVPSAFAADEWSRRARIPEQRLRVIPTGVDLGAFHPLDGAQRDHVRERLGLLPDLPTVVYAGRIVHSKGVHVLLEAVRVLGKPVQVLLCGAAQDERYLSELRAAHGRSPLRLRPREVSVAEAMAASDLLVLPSIRPETQGMVLAEAMACGIPAVASDIGGLPQSLRAFPGHLFPAGDVTGLVARLRALLSWRQDEPSLGDRGRQWVGQNLSISVTAAAVSGALAAAVENPCTSIRPDAV